MVEAHLGEDLSRLGSLLATLEAAYGTGATVGPDELEPYLGQPGSVPPWDLTDAIDKGETEAALKVLHRLMEAGDRHPLVVLAILHRHFGNILRVQSPAITSEGEAAEALGIAKGRSTFPARKALDAARRLGPRRQRRRRNRPGGRRAGAQGQAGLGAGSGARSAGGEAVPDFSQRPRRPAAGT